MKMTMEYWYAAFQTPGLVSESPINRSKGSKVSIAITVRRRESTAPRMISVPKDFLTLLLSPCPAAMEVITENPAVHPTANWRNM